jgi:PAS domain S-box-containing protein
MPIESDAEFVRLRTALRDLVAISTLQATWARRDPPDIAAGLADVLIGSLRLEFAFVRLCDSTRNVAVEMTRGNAWKSFPEWLQGRLAVVPDSRKEIIPDVGGSLTPCCGVVVPIGVNAQGGLVAVASNRIDFPAEIDLLLLSVAANHAASAFQSALAEQDLRRARSELETKVAERTVELRRTTAELQTILDASPVGIALFGKDQAVQRCNRAFEHILGWKADEIAGRPASILKNQQCQPGALSEKLDGGEAFASVEARLLRKDGSEFDAAVSCVPFRDDSGSPAGFVGTIQDISDYKRTDEALRRSEAYLAEAQRLTHTGSWAYSTRTGEPTHSSEEFCRLLGFDPEMGPPSSEDFRQRLHPEDRARAGEIRARAIREKTGTDHTFRALLPDGTIRHIHTVSHPVFGASGEVVEMVGTSMDVTERKHLDDERERLLAGERAHLWFFESMDRINRAIQGTNDLEQMMSDVLGEVLSIFDCDRAWLVYPCDPEAASWGVPMEQTRPEFPGAFSLGREMPMDPGTIKVFQAMRASNGPLQFGPGSERPVPLEIGQRFGVQSLISMAVYPKGDRPYLFGLHQCSRPRLWTTQEERLFQEIGRRLADALTSLLMFRNLRESEAKLGAAQRIAHVGYWERVLETNAVTWSDETYRIFGLVPGQDTIDFNGIQELIHPEDRQLMAQAAAEAARGGRRYDVEYRVRRPDGEERIVHSQGDLTRDESGRPLRVFGILQDITERKRAEAEVRDSEARYRYIFQSTGVSIWEEDFSRVKDAIDELKAEGVRDFRGYCAAHPEFVERSIAMVKIADVNDATVDLFAADGKDDLLVSLNEVFLPETLKVFVEVVVAIAEGRTSCEAETVLQTLKGERLAVLFTMTLPPPPGRLDNVLVTLMNITARKRAEHLTVQVFESLPDRVSIVGSDYRFRRVNPVFVRNWNVPAAKIVGMHVADLVGVEAFEQRVKPNLDRCFAGEDVSDTDWFSGTHGRRYLALSFSPLRPDSDRVEAALVIVRDLTDHMLASEALRQAQADLAHISRVTTMGELTASLAHEINQPIAAAVTNANACLRWLGREHPDLDEAREAAARIVKDGRRAADIISRIRLLFKKGAPQREWLDVNEVIQEMIVLLRGEAARYSIPIRPRLAAGLPKVSADRVQLQQVFMNLMLNAIDAIKDAGGEGELIIGSEQAGDDQLLISVSDTGVGLPAQHAAQIFDAFFTTKPDGTGMGLPISRSIIESHGGRLWAAANPERGATFHFTLPSGLEERP